MHLYAWPRLLSKHALWMPQQRMVDSNTVTAVARRASQDVPLYSATLHAFTVPSGGHKQLDVDLQVLTGEVSAATNLVRNSERGIPMYSPSPQIINYGCGRVKTGIVYQFKTMSRFPMAAGQQDPPIDIHILAGYVYFELLCCK